MLDNIVYIRMKQRIKVPHAEWITLGDIAQIVTSFEPKDKLLSYPLCQMTYDNGNVLVMDGFQVIKQLKTSLGQLEFECIGNTATIITKVERWKKRSIFVVAFVWLLLFLGTAMTIINFHYDVSMQEVQQRLHYLFTGEQVTHPLFIQIPYSIGLGIGMIIFLKF